MYKTKLYIPIGISGQGKSTYSNSVIKKDPSVRIISSDEIRKELFGTGYKYNPNDNEKVFEIMNERTKRSLEGGYSVYYDATNIDQQYRSNLIKEMFPYTNKIVGLYFPVDVEIAIQRNAMRKAEEYVPENVIRKMSQQIKCPTIQEGFDEITLILR